MKQVSEKMTEQIISYEYKLYSVRMYNEVDTCYKPLEGKGEGTYMNLWLI